jgi:hypothetical protein
MDIKDSKERLQAFDACPEIKRISLLHAGISSPPTQVLPPRDPYPDDWEWEIIRAMEVTKGTIQRKFLKIQAATRPAAETVNTDSDSDDDSLIGVMKNASNSNNAASAISNDMAFQLSFLENLPRCLPIMTYGFHVNKDHRDCNEAFCFCPCSTTSLNTVAGRWRNLCCMDADNVPICNRKNKLDVLRAPNAFLDHLKGITGCPFHLIMHDFLTELYRHFYGQDKRHIGFSKTNTKEYNLSLRHARLNDATSATAPGAAGEDRNNLTNLPSNENVSNKSSSNIQVQTEPAPATSATVPAAEDRNNPTNKAPPPHGNRGAGSSSAKRKFDLEIGLPMLTEMWRARVQDSSKRSEFGRFCFERGWYLDNSKRTLRVPTPRLDAEWTAKGVDPLKVCSWSKYNGFVIALEKESPPCPEVETTTLLAEYNLTEQSIEAVSGNMDIVEKEKVLTFCHALNLRYQKATSEDDSSYPLYRQWKVNLEMMSQELLRLKDSVQEDFETTTTTANETPPLPNNWPRGYTFGSETRVLRVDFRIILKTGDTNCPKLFYQCLERTDIAVVSVGSVTVGDNELYTLQHLCKSGPTYVHHSYQQFSITDNHLVSETSLEEGLKFADYKSKIDQGALLYLTDLPIKDVPDLEDDFNSATRPRRDMMPGGPHCLMQHVSKVSVPSANVICISSTY